MQTTPSDITANKHRGNQQSKQAHKARQHASKRQRDKVFNAIKRSGNRGITAHELADRWGVSVNQISGRFSELKADGLAKKKGVRLNFNGRPCGVIVASN